MLSAKERLVAVLFFTATGGACRPARRDTEDDTSPLEPDHEGPQSDEDDGPQVAVGHTNGTRTR